MTDAQSTLLLFALFLASQGLICAVAVCLVLGWQTRREIKEITKGTGL